MCGGGGGQREREEREGGERGRRESGVGMTGMGWRVRLSFVNGSVLVVLPIPDQTFGTCL